MMVAVAVADVDLPVVVRERLEAFAGGVLAEATNRPVQMVNGGLSRPVFDGDCFVWSRLSFDGDGWLSFDSVEVLDLDGWAIVECFVEAAVVEPGDVLHDGELEL